MVEGDFVNGYLKAYDARTGECLFNENYMETSSESEEGHYGADRLMVEDIQKNLTEGAPLPVSIIDALGAGILALRIDQARNQNKLVDMSDVWQRFDSLHVDSCSIESVAAR